MSQKSLTAPNQAALSNALILAGVLVMNEATPTTPVGISISWIPPLPDNDAMCVLLMDDALISAEEQTRIWTALASNLSFTEPVRVFAGQPQADLIPTQVTTRQAKRALLDAKWLGITDEQMQDSISKLFDAFPEPLRSKAIIDWRESQTFDRDNPLITSMSKQLGKSEKQIDDLFVVAAKLK